MRSIGAIVKTVLFGYGVVCLADRAGPQGIPRSRTQPVQSRPEEAEQLLDEAGYPRGANKMRFKVPLDYNPIGDENRRLAEFMRAALARIGITIEIRAADASAFVKRIYTDRDFEITFNGHSNLFDPTVGVQRRYWSKNFKKGVPFSNASHDDNPKVDALLEGRQSRTIRSSVWRCSGIPGDRRARICPTSIFIRRSISPSRTSACMTTR